MGQQRGSNQVALVSDIKSHRRQDQAGLRLTCKCDEGSTRP